MTRSSINYKVCVLIVLAAIWAPSSVTRAEQPPATTPAPESKAVQLPRAKPQIIYRVPRPSGYAANLHSQSKTQSHPLPIDNSMPTSLQMSRAAANEAAARAEQEHSASEKNARSPREKVKRPKMQSNRPQVRGRGHSKARGPRKSGKK